MTRSTATFLLRLSAILWIVWGVVHMFAGVMTIAGDTPTAVRGIADAVEPAVLEMAYPAAVGAVVNQHGFNLLWIGAVTLFGAPFVWRRSVTAIFVVAMVGGLADLGYFLFLDLGGFVNFVPGTVMTLVSSAAILSSFTAFFLEMKRAEA